jgi:N-acetylmuramoyl-L-alanine amidase
MVQLNFPIMRRPRCHAAITGIAVAALLLAIRGGAGAAPAAKRSEPVCERGTFRVVLDVGHTAEEPGAISVRSATEYDFNLKLAGQIEQVLIGAGFARTVTLVTSGPKQRALIKRVIDANAAKADLLVSIHHDSVPQGLLQHMDEEGGPKRFSDRFKGHSIFVSYENSDRAGSLQFGKLLGQQLKAKGLQFTPHYTEKFMGARRRQLLDAEAGVYRFDKLHVLRAARMPAVLFEAGLIINPAEETILAGDERQKLMAAAMKDAVELFCTARARHKPKDIARPARR